MEDDKKVTVRDVLLHTKLVSEGAGDRDLQAANDSGDIALRNGGRQEWGVGQFDDATWANQIHYKGKVASFDVNEVIANRSTDNWVNSAITREEAKTPRNDEIYKKGPNQLGGIESSKIGALMTYKKALQAHEKAPVRFLSEKPFEGKVLGSVELAGAHFNVLKGDKEWMLAKKTPELNAMVGLRVKVVGEVQENGYLKAQVKNVTMSQRKDRTTIKERIPIDRMPKSKTSQVPSLDKKKGKGGNGGFER